MGAVRKKTDTEGLYLRINKTSKVYCMDKMINGITIRRSFRDAKTLPEAKIEFFRIVTETLAKHGTSHSFDINKLRINDLLSLYLEESFQFKKGAKKWYSLFRTLRDKLGDLLFLSLNKAVIDKYKTERSRDVGERTKRPISARTIQAELGILSAAINYAVDSQIVPNNPINRFCKVKLPNPPKIVLDNGKAWGEEFTAIFNALGDTTNCSDKINQANLQLLILTLYETGMRPNEVLHLEWEWMHKESDPDRYVIFIPKEITKTNQARYVPVSPRLLEALRNFQKKYKPKNNLVFPSPRSGGVRYEGTINKPFDTALRKAGISKLIKKYTIYALRRTRASIWDRLDEGACEYALGHSPQNVHRKHYSVVNFDRLFNLVGLDSSQEESQ